MLRTAPEGRLAFRPVHRHEHRLEEAVDPAGPRLGVEDGHVLLD